MSRPTFGRKNYFKNREILLCRCIDFQMWTISSNMFDYYNYQTIRKGLPNFLRSYLSTGVQIFHFWNCLTIKASLMSTFISLPIFLQVSYQVSSNIDQYNQETISWAQDNKFYIRQPQAGGTTPTLFLMFHWAKIKSAHIEMSPRSSLNISKMKPYQTIFKLLWNEALIFVMFKINQVINLGPTNLKVSLICA